MDDEVMKLALELLVKHEGLRLKSYRCPAGFTTVGVGRNLETKGISRSEAISLLKNDIEECYEKLFHYDWFQSLIPTRIVVVIEMMFNLGERGFKKFKKFLKALDNQDYDQASVEMLDSAWAKQVGRRANELAEIMRTGIYKRGK